MDKLQLWSKGISLVTIISGVMLSLIPASKLLSSFKTLVAVILTVMFISPLTVLINEDIEKNIFTSDRASKNEIVSIADSQLYYCAQNIVEDKIQEVFTAENINAESHVIITDKNDSIFIEKIIITGEFDDIEKNFIKQKMNELFQLQMNIEFSG